MNRLPKPRTVIWDMDGTLIDQTAAIVRCYAEVIQDMGYPEPDLATIHRSMGGPMRSTLEIFLKEDEIEEAGKRFRARFPVIMFDGLIVLPGAHELVETFAQARIPQAILTNKHGPTARDVSRHCGFDRHIPVCIGNKDTEYSKPDPLLTTHVLNALEAEIGDACLIGDSPTDVATAKNAGLPCYTVITGAHSQDELLDAGAAAAFDSLVELKAAFSL
ncbi:MAG: HAD family hydrolase [Verrucomicrobiota bacterium]